MTSPITCARIHLNAVSALLLLAVTAATAPAINIIAIGDSITQGGNSSGVTNGTKLAYASYRYPLFFQLTGAGYDVDFVGPQNETRTPTSFWPINTALYPLYATAFDRDHAGYWGQTSANIKTPVVNWLNTVSADQAPDIAIINIGTNDAAGGVAVATFTANLQGIVAALRAVNPDVTLILSNLAGIDKPEYAAAFATYNAAIADFAANPANSTPTSGIVLADIKSGLPDNALYDLIHPNEIGEAHLAQVYFDAIAASLVPEPAALALLAGVATLAAVVILRRRSHARSSG
ncbi:PEP-CTERM putative exosortase interaction domain-containing protein [Opitutaceae bacterium TAV1]|nr:PEP-CTERM putative exosortase interaction domain-containing protein [Opitutaceae bacterium TAV1]